MKKEIKICIVAFSDKEGNSIAYKKFSNGEFWKAVQFYTKQLNREDVNVISTRKTYAKSHKKNPS